MTKGDYKKILTVSQVNYLSIHDLILQEDDIRFNFLLISELTLDDYNRLTLFFYFLLFM